MTPLERARRNERLANEALAQGNIAAAQAYQANIAQQLSRSGTPLPGVSNVQSRVNAAVAAAQPPRPAKDFTQPIGVATPTGSLSSFIKTDPNTDATEEDYQSIRDRQEAKGILMDALRMYGLEGLVGDLDRIIKDSGNSASVAMNQIRQTEAYRDRFKGLLGLQQRGVTDVANEAEYINLESQYRQVFRDAGVQNFLGDAGSKPERDAIAKLVGDFSLSVNEVKDRVTDAQRVVAETPQEVRDSLQRYYNIDPATLTSYVLDPTRTSSEINRRANAAILGGYAQRQGLEFGAGVSERIGSLMAGEGDLMGTQAEPQLTTIAEAARATKRLGQIEQSALSDEDVALSTLDLDATAKERVEGLKSRERARFGGSGAFTSTALTGVNKI